MTQETAIAAEGPGIGRGRAARAVQYLGPRDAGHAARAASWLFQATAVAVLASTVLDLIVGSRTTWAGGHSGFGPWTATGMALAAVLWGIAWVVRRLPQRVITPAAMALPLVACAILLAANLATGDASPGAQVMIVLPVLFAASELRPAGAIVVAAAAVVALQATAWSQLVVGAAFHDVAYGTMIMVTATVVLMNARTARDRLHAELQQRALVDPTTGASQREVLDRSLAKALASPKAAGTALIMIDLDHFKSVNDRFGHLTGDAALSHATRVIRTHTRTGDVVARMGGDELAVLLPGCAEDAAVARAKTMVSELHGTPLVAGGVSVPLSLSAGVAHSTRHGRDVEALYASADRGLYLAKRSGRNRVEVA